MPDVVVTVPQSFGLDTWIDEGDPAGVPWSGNIWHFYLGDSCPDIKPGERVYVIFNGALRGYAPLIHVEKCGWRWALVRHGDAVAVSIPQYTQGFRGFRYRWWERDIEQAFPNWQDPDAALFTRLPRDTSHAIVCRRPMRQHVPKLIEEQPAPSARTFWTDMKRK